MATINPTYVTIDDDTIAVTWETLTSANAVGAPIHPRFNEYADRCVHILGTFDSATAVWQGSNDGTNYLGLTDPSSTAISKTAAGIEQVLEGALYQRPSTSGGAGSQDIDVICVMRRNRAR